MKQGPNVKKLIIHKMSLDAVPSGGGFNDALRFLMDKDRIIGGCRAATEWVEKSIQAVKSAMDNPYGDDDEAIAAEILKNIEERKMKR